MSQPFDPTALSKALGIGAPPASLTREGRVRLIGEVTQALLKGELPSRQARLWVGGALLEWLQRGGNLERDYFEVTKPKSHHTPSAIWRALHPDEGGKPKRR